jgi:hypothetical protein
VKIGAVARMDRVDRQAHHRRLRPVSLDLGEMPDEPEDRQVARRARRRHRLLVRIGPLQLPRRGSAGNIVDSVSD